MINASLKNPIVEKNLTILEMMAEMDKLREENMELKVERDDWKEGFTILHNKMKELNIDYTLPQTEDGETGDMSYVDEYAKGNAEWDNLRIPKELDWKYEA